MNGVYSFRYNDRHTLSFKIGDYFFFSKNDQVIGPGYSEVFVASGAYKLEIVIDLVCLPQIKFVRERSIYAPQYQ